MFVLGLMICDKRDWTNWNTYIIRLFMSLCLFNVWTDPDSQWGIWTRVIIVIIVWSGWKTETAHRGTMPRNRLLLGSDLSCDKVIRSSGRLNKEDQIIQRAEAATNTAIGFHAGPYAISEVDMGETIALNLKHNIESSPAARGRCDILQSRNEASLSKIRICLHADLSLLCAFWYFWYGTWQWSYLRTDT